MLSTHNVVGALSSNGRRDYQAVLEAFTGSKVPMPESGRWANAGMVRGRGVDLAWAIYDARHFGTAQRRRRLFLVCDFRGKRAGEILFVPKSLSGYFAAGGTPRQGAAAFAESRAGAEGEGPVAMRPLCISTGQANAAILDNQSPTLTAAHERPFLIQPRAVSAGFRNKAGASSGSIGYEEETAPTLLARQESSVMKAYVIGAYCSGGMLSDNPHSGIYEAETTRTLDTSGGNPCCQQGGTVIVEVPGSEAHMDAASMNYQNPIRIGCHIRRLTTTEAERLMGFPDFWTAYGCDGREISDSKRFSMLGNSVAVPCVAYIMQGITGVLERGGTL